MQPFYFKHKHTHISLLSNLLGKCMLWEMAAMVPALLPTPPATPPPALKLWAPASVRGDGPDREQPGPESPRGMPAVNVPGALPLNGCQGELSP